MAKPITQNILDQIKVAEVELIYRSKVRPQDRPVISNAASAYRILLQAWDENKINLQEQFKILLLNTANRCLGIAEIGTGGMSSCIVDPKLIFVTALKGKVSGIILAHNHPFGNLEPSKADIEFTRKVIQAGKLLDISVLDHFIVAPSGFTSFANKGLIFI